MNEMSLARRLRILLACAFLAGAGMYVVTTPSALATDYVISGGGGGAGSGDANPLGGAGATGAGSGGNGISGSSGDGGGAYSNIGGTGNNAANGGTNGSGGAVGTNTSAMNNSGTLYAPDVGYGNIGGSSNGGAGISILSGTVTVTLDGDDSLTIAGGNGGMGGNSDDGGGSGGNIGSTNTAIVVNLATTSGSATNVVDNLTISGGAGAGTRAEVNSGGRGGDVNVTINAAGGGGQDIYLDTVSITGGGTVNRDEAAPYGRSGDVIFTINADVFANSFIINTRNGAVDGTIDGALKIANDGSFKTGDTTTGWHDNPDHDLILSVDLIETGKTIEIGSGDSAYNNDIDGEGSTSGDVDLTIGMGGIYAKNTGGLSDSTAILISSGDAGVDSDSYYTNSGDVEVTVEDGGITAEIGNIDISSGDAIGELTESGNVYVGVTGNVVAGNKLIIATGKTTNESDDDTSSGYTSVYVDGNVITGTGYEILAGDGSTTTDHGGSMGNAGATIAGNLVVLGTDALPANNAINFQAGNGGADSNGANVRVSGDSEHNIDGNIGALNSALSIKGGNTSGGVYNGYSGYDGGNADITVGGAGMTKAQWTTYMATTVNSYLPDAMDPLDRWDATDMNVTTYSANKTIEDAKSTFAVVVDDITLTGGSLHQYADGSVGNTSNDGGDATLTLTNTSETYGASIYSAGNITIESGADNRDVKTGTAVSTGYAGIEFKGNAGEAKYGEIGTGNNVYLGGDMEITSSYKSFAGLINAGTVVFLGADADSDDTTRLSLVNEYASGTIHYNALATDFSNLSGEDQTAEITIITDGEGLEEYADDVKLGQLRYAANTNFIIQDGQVLTDALNDDQVILTAGSTVTSSDFVYNPQDGIDFVFEIGDDAVYGDSDDPKNVMVTYEDGIEFGNNVNNEVVLHLADADGDLANTGILPDGAWKDTLVLIQSGADGATTTQTIVGHVKNGDHNQFIQTNDYDIIAAIWKGRDDSSFAPDSQILLNRVDARYLKGQAILQNRIASVAFTNAAWDSNWNFLERFASMRDDCGGVGAFGNVGYTKSRVGADTGRYNSDSKVDVKGMNAIAGMHYRTKNVEQDSLFTGVFFEGGWGDYDAYDSFDLTGQAGNLLRSHGDGDVNYYGGGIYLRKELPVGLNIMAAGRVGRLDTDYKNATFKGYNQQGDLVSHGMKKFDLDSTYYGASLGFSWDISRSDRHQVEPFALFHWNRQQGKNNVRPYTNARIDIDDVDSMRLQVGLKYAYTFTCNEDGSALKGFAGAAWEHEFDGESSGQMWFGTNPAAVRVRNNTLKGGTGVGHLGIRYETKSRWYIDAVIHGSVGKRDSWGGNVGAGVSF